MFAPELGGRTGSGCVNGTTATVGAAPTSAPRLCPRQLRERRYADKYRAAGDSIHLIGVEFSRAARNITAFETAAA